MKEYKISLKLNENDESDLGSTHFLGCPDVPVEWNDNAVFYNDEIFLGQINLKEYSIEGLPNKGILYFFLAVESKPYRGIVRYASDDSNIERVDFNQEIDFCVDLNKEYISSICEGNGNISMFKEKDSKITLNKDEVMLLYIDTNNLLSDVFKLYSQQVAYIIKTDDLINKRFEKARLSLLLDC